MSGYPFGKFLGLFMTAVMVLASSAAAAQVYRWVDENGITQFSQLPPPGAQPGMEPMPLYAPPPPATDPSADFYSIQNQLQRMEERRMAVEKHRAEARAANQRARTESLQQQLLRQELEGESEPRYRSYWGSWYGYSYPYFPGYRRPWRHPGHRPGRPGHGGRPTPYPSSGQGSRGYGRTVTPSFGR